MSSSLLIFPPWPLSFLYLHILQGIVAQASLMIMLSRLPPSRLFNSPLNFNIPVPNLLSTQAYLQGFYLYPFCEEVIKEQVIWKFNFSHVREVFRKGLNEKIQKEDLNILSSPHPLYSICYKEQGIFLIMTSGAGHLTTRIFQTLLEGFNIIILEDYHAMVLPIQY